MKTVRRLALKPSPTTQSSDKPRLKADDIGTKAPDRWHPYRQPLTQVRESRVSQMIAVRWAGADR